MNSKSQIVSTNINYNYEILQKNIKELKNTYSFFKIGSIGDSVLEKNISYIKIGQGKREVLYHAGIHANEFITSNLLMKFIEEFSKAISLNSVIYGQSAKKLFNMVSLYIIPMVNPDGIDLVTGKLEKNSNIYKNYVKIAKEYPNIPFPNGWKANFNGVDLNLQFPAEWEKAKQIKFSQGFIKPAPRDFVGKAPLTQPEAIALYEFTLKHNFDLTISYHTQGKEIYSQFLNYKPSKAKKIGETFAKVSKYKLAQVPYNSSFAGYKDWFIQKYNKPSFTIEAGIRRKSTTYNTISRNL